MPEAFSRCVLTGADFRARGLTKTDRLRAKRLAVVFLDFVVIAHARTGEAHQLPANHACVSAMHGIAEHAFDGVLAEQREKDCRLDLAQSLVLRGRCEEMKTAQAFQAFAVDFARRGGTLVTELARRILERRLRVAKTIA